jgi:hypothetical protein
LSLRVAFRSHRSHDPAPHADDARPFNLTEFGSVERISAGRKPMRA